MVGAASHSRGGQGKPGEARGGPGRRSDAHSSLAPGLLLLRPLRLLPPWAGSLGSRLPPQHGPHPPRPSAWGVAEGPTLGMFLWGHQASSPPSLGSPPPLAPRPPPWPRGAGCPLPPLGASPPPHAETRAQSPPWGQHCSVLPLPWGSWPAGRRYTGRRALRAPHPPAPSSAPSQGSPSLLSKLQVWGGGPATIPGTPPPPAGVSRGPMEL